MKSWLVAVFVLTACASPPEGVHVDAVGRIGSVPNPPPSTGRDVGFSALLDGRSVRALGDTLFVAPGTDGLHWRSSTWSWTEDLDSSDCIGPFVDAMGDDAWDYFAGRHDDASNYRMLTSHRRLKIAMPSSQASTLALSRRRPPDLARPCSVSTRVAQPLRRAMAS